MMQSKDRSLVEAPEKAPGGLSTTPDSVTPDTEPSAEVLASTALGQMLESEVSDEIDKRHQEELERQGRLAAHD